MQQKKKPHPLIDRIIETEEELIQYVGNLRKKGIKEICLDLEGDQGSIRYAYSISIFQIYDGEETVIIDVLKMGNNSILRDFLTRKDIVKIMFSCHNDIYMTQNVLNCTISPVRDIAAGQKLLGQPVNLSDHIKVDKTTKDTFQRANWLKRPIHPSMLEYAINDVLQLFDIENAITAQLQSLNLYSEYILNSSLPTRRSFRVDQQKQYSVKFPGYPRMSDTQKRQAATLWIFRELLGKHLNSPVGYLLSKKSMSYIVRHHPDKLQVLLERELNLKRRGGKRIPTSLIERLYKKAIRSENLPPL
ncbi:Ribonuclease D [Chitinispirillum alkaliphilum]|nr:Ribonuclease D [Chitinispirillum alkaliphilum]